MNAERDAEERIAATGRLTSATLTLAQFDKVSLVPLALHPHKAAFPECCGIQPDVERKQRGVARQLGERQAMPMAEQDPLNKQLRDLVTYRYPPGWSKERTLAWTMAQ